ncbi:hypothetical protein B0H11DRAFT_2235065 [Mycena galericulata]|nr:hypothetical protein B0H11DRAFT_2235065 [Mycena galericulata]
MAYNTRFSTVYATFVRRLRYTVVSSSDVYLTFPVLCQALNAMDGLYSLCLDIPSDQAQLLMLSFKRYGLLRERILAATRLLRTSSGANSPQPNNTLSRLRRIRLEGDPGLVALLVHREVDELIISRQLDYQAFNEVCSLVDSSIHGSKLTVLNISLDPSLDLVGVVAALAEVVPNLESFWVDQQRCDLMVRFPVDA